MKRDKRNKLGLDNSLIKSKDNGIIEDSTEYGEFISSFDAWITPEEQKRKARYLEEISEEISAENENNK